MTRVAAEAADGMLVHGFTTERYLREITLPSSMTGCTPPAAAATGSASATRGSSLPATPTATSRSR